MEVKGTAYLARKAMLEREIGQERFTELLRAVAARDPVFAGPILATTRIPIDAFMRFNEAIVDRVYGGDQHSYFRFGEQARRGPSRARTSVWSRIAASTSSSLPQARLPELLH